ncbi:tRNA (cytidine(34)-2'-O)-methyltransferase [Acuticoccus sp. I52.16.1]|uniref:tRNA (cytidine(34)-2'-O)-methyltransferase n=1 Tax=Acuticoccus sp. I52.16.1 TaxID=2928472 RepID=UPI001FD36421|nr:tRNA (cytidine(34)-2'-O)-methyltransferase [Acuticoccus sp. I52.16.1]UOM33182.1 tRNA (cytidine(34)-2'-O)-methyltransferase [Acuticoccus sp. I52.16.1]
MNVALFQPEIPQNTAAILRTLACLGARGHIIGPAAFDLSPRAIRRAGLDYAATVPLTQHPTFDAFKAAAPGRVVLFTTRADMALTDFAFDQSDTLLFGRESAGVPDEVHAAADVRLRIPLVPGARSLNLAVAVGIALMTATVSSGALVAKGLK